MEREKHKDKDGQRENLRSKIAISSEPSYLLGCPKQTGENFETHETIDYFFFSIDKNIFVKKKRFF